MQFIPENFEISMARQSLPECSAMQKPYPWAKTNISYGKCRINQILVKFAIFKENAAFNDANNPGVIWYKRLYTLLHRTCKQNTVSIKTNLWPHT